MSAIVRVSEWLFLKLNYEHREYKARAERAEAKLVILADKFPGVAETVNDLADKVNVSPNHPEL